MRLENGETFTVWNWSTGFLDSNNQNRISHLRLTENWSQNGWGLGLRLKVRGHKSSLALLGRVGDALVQRGEAGEQGVALILLGLPEFGVGAVEPIQHTEDPETLVEPGTRKNVWVQLFQIIYKQESNSQAKRIKSVFSLWWFSNLQHLESSFLQISLK